MPDQIEYIENDNGIPAIRSRDCYVSDPLPLAKTDPMYAELQQVSSTTLASSHVDSKSTLNVLDSSP